MTEIKRWRSALALAAVVLLLGAGAAFAQADTGNLYGTVTDNQGQVLPGVTVTLSGIGAPQVQVSDAQGQFRFLNLSPGNYRIESALEGFSTVVYETVNIRVGRNTTIELTLSPAVEETITVTTESPLLDQRKIGQSTSVTALELEKIPTARDPWSVAQQTPGVVMDRINVGGNESGQQAQFVGTGARGDQNVFMVDGVNITDMTALGGSATYFGFEQFEEMQFSTGGTDISVLTPGVQLNMVTKRGTNEWRGSGTYFLTDGDWQSETGFDEGELATGQAPLELNQIVDVTTYSAELGGPVLRDRLWIWGSYDFSDINGTVAGGQRDDTDLENYAGKLNAQILPSNSAVVTYNMGDKVKTGRGAGPDRAPETTLNQDGPSPLTKIEDTQVFGSSFFLTGSYAKMKGGFALEPQGGRELEGILGPDGVLRGTYYGYLENERPTEEWKLNGSSFFNTSNVSHELKFGGSYRTAQNDSLFGVTGRGVYNYSGEIWGLPAGNTEVALVWRDRHVLQELTYQAAWLQDTLTWENLTFNAGLRYDIQDGENLASNVPGARVNTPFMSQAINFPGNDPEFEWENISPRLGLTYALGEERNTLLRGSFSRFVDQLGTGVVEHVNPIGFTFGVYYFTDLNGNLVFDAGPEVNNASFRFPVGFNPLNPTNIVTVNQIDPDFEAKTTDEAIIGIEHAWRPEFVTGLNVTFRQVDNIARLVPFVRDTTTNQIRLQTRDDYIPFSTVSGTLPDGSGFSEQVFVLRPGLTNAGGNLLTTGGREQEYLGFTANFTKRLSNQWMLRGHFTWSDWSWNIDDEFFRFDDPTNSVVLSGDLQDTQDDDGAIVAEQSGGSGNKGDVFLNSEWSFNFNGLYQVAPDQPWGFNLGFNVTGRQGTPIPYFVNVTRPRGGNIAVQVTDEVDSFRYDDLYTFDARIDKDFEIGDVRLTASLDGFNLFNEGTVMQRERNLSGGRPNFVDEALSPRVLRVGLRLAFR